MTLCVISKYDASPYSSSKIVDKKHVVKEVCLKDDVVRSANCKVSSPDIVSMLDKFHVKQSQAPCYCHVNVCGKYSVPKIFKSCRNGLVHVIKCGGCVRCAKDMGESCGGISSMKGVCRRGFVCEVKDAIANVGVCVPDLANNTHPDKFYLRTKVSFNSKLLVKECARHLLESTVTNTSFVRPRQPEKKKNGNKGLNSTGDGQIEATIFSTTRFEASDPKDDKNTQSYEYRIRDQLCTFWAYLFYEKQERAL